MSEAEAWFAGLIDGEGCFTIGVSLQHRRSLKLGLLFSISMKKRGMASSRAKNTHVASDSFSHSAAEEPIRNYRE